MNVAPDADAVVDLRLALFQAGYETAAFEHRRHENPEPDNRLPRGYGRRARMKAVADRKVQGIDAKNQDFIRYDQVHKRQEYRLAEADDNEAFDEAYRINTVDIGRFLHGGRRDRRSFSHELGQALREIGFAILEGHGVDPKLFEEATQRTLELFTRPSLEEKLRFRAQRHGSVNQGYFPLKETSDIHPDLVEGWVFCRRAFDLGEGPSLPGRIDEFWPIPDL